jgi:hypothetical protein
VVGGKQWLVEKVALHRIVLLMLIVAEVLILIKQV